ncbi:MAG: SEL1-like repeat protein [Bauldia sp.]
MARFEMTGAEMAPMAQVAPSGETFYQLGITYATGRDVAQDLVAAHKWFNLAALRGNQEAAQRRQEIASELSAAEISAAQRAAREWLRAH